MVMLQDILQEIYRIFLKSHKFYEKARSMTTSMRQEGRLMYMGGGGG